MDYIDSVLLPRLRIYSLNENTVKIVSTDIYSRLASIIARWDDVVFRHTILTIGKEEATFYSPDADIDIKALVVCCVRNSLIEDLCSTDAAAIKYGYSQRPIPDTDIIYFTKEAIEYFSKSVLSGYDSSILGDDDPFFPLKELYPLAWEAIRQLGHLETQYIRYSPINFRKGNPENLLGNSHGKLLPAIVESGMEPTLDPSFQSALRNLIHSPAGINSDSFKSLTRHPDKLFRIIEIILLTKSQLVMTNYLITVCAVGKRVPLLKPGQRTGEMMSNMRNCDGLSRQHEVAKRNALS